MSLKSFILSAHLAASLISLGGSTGAWTGELDRLAIADLQQRLGEIDSELAILYAVVFVVHVISHLSVRH